MEQFFLTYPAMAVVVIIALLGLIGWLIRMAVKDKIERMAKQEVRMDAMESNYKGEFKLMRLENKAEFARITTDQVKSHSDVINILTEIRIKVAGIESDIKRKKKSQNSEC